MGAFAAVPIFGTEAPRVQNCAHNEGQRIRNRREHIGNGVIYENDSDSMKSLK